MFKILYRSLVDSLSFLAGRTRPDISYTINIFSQFQENPGITHWNGLLKLLGYISYTNDLRLNLSNIQDLNLTAYSDADFANNRDDRISMNGQIVFIDQVPVTWRSFKQESICLNSMESEFVALTETAKELKLHNKFSIPLHNPFETAKKLQHENRVQNTTGHGNGSRRSVLVSLMFELFTTTTRETTDTLTSPDRHRIFPFRRREVTSTADVFCGSGA
ncbi:Retrovirus-related Pol polyprotein from transposon RE2 [Araneus ventricosus]|uniref:Retrovirus-related Pol polyprotein from transposon RE2 n=1 Tax=Araneus ventricosus TaxID=182803 RepID=A0A4Y2ENX6_ARAVE|nr:Retrovirus-related Pol polyprotein from transposon RE2 [Araneus ventricosus]